MKHALALTACTIALLAGCGDDDAPAADSSALELYWTATPATTRQGLCVNGDDVGFDVVGHIWEESWHGDGTTDDATIAAFLEEKCA